jgi:hypothetical protein
MVENTVLAPVQGPPKLIRQAACFQPFRHLATPNFAPGTGSVTNLLPRPLVSGATPA